jgi:mRNA interferase RelE/StbE
VKYKVVIHKRVIKYLEKIPISQKEIIKSWLRVLEMGEFQSLKVRRMEGQWKGYKRFRVGSIRVIFYLDEKEQTIYVDYIGSRGDIYKK